MLTSDMLYATAGHRSGGRQADIVAAIVSAAPQVLPGYGIRPLRRLAHFLAQLCHESDSWRTTVEYASGADYEGRANLGNTEPGDGPRYRGRGLIQLTGRHNYRWASGLLGIDLVAAPEQAAEPALSLRIACLYWADRDLNRLADANDLRGLTRLINGGTNGIAHRRQCHRRAVTALVQQRLADLGHAPGPVDGAHGPRTTAALAAFRRETGLGVYGAITLQDERALWPDMHSNDEETAS